MTQFTHFEADTLPIQVNVTFAPGAEITSLTGGACVAIAESDAGTIVSADSCVITSSTTVKAIFGAGDLPSGLWRIQIRATVSGIVQTLADLRVTSVHSIS